MTNEKVLREYNLVVKYRKRNRLIGLIFSLIFIGFGISGYWIDSIASISKVNFHSVFLYLGAGMLGANIANNAAKKEMALLRKLMSKLDLDK